MRIGKWGRTIALRKECTIRVLFAIIHRFALDDIVDACELFSNRRDGVLKVAMSP